MQQHDYVPDVTPNTRVLNIPGWTNPRADIDKGEKKAMEKIIADERAARLAAAGLRPIKEHEITLFALLVVTELQPDLVRIANHISAIVVREQITPAQLAVRALDGWRAVTNYDDYVKLGRLIRDFRRFIVDAHDELPSYVMMRSD